MTPTHFDTDMLIVGGGILGLANALEAAELGRDVTLLERHQRARGASVRNFGMIWPIGQPAGHLHDLARRSRRRWIEVAQEAGFRCDPCGSVHLATRDDELAVMAEFAASDAARDYPVELLDDKAARTTSPAATPAVIGGLWSTDECAVDPRSAIPSLTRHLVQALAVDVRPGQCVVDVQPTRDGGFVATTTRGTRWTAREILICSGHELHLLLPELLDATGIRPCLLQMLDTNAQPPDWRLGPHVASGLSLRHYRTFEACPGLPALRERIARETPELDQHGIHVMAAQTAEGHVVLGDSHHYHAEPPPFRDEVVDDLILRELRKLIDLPDWSLRHRWTGVYAKHPAEPFIYHELAPGFRLLTGIGGNGMTLSFGLAEDIQRARLAPTPPPLPWTPAPRTPPVHHV